LGEYALNGGELEGARLDATLSFPGQIKSVLGKWRVSASTTVNDRPVQVVQGDGARGLVATLYFDKETGLLIRLVRYGSSPIGRFPTQVDYADYRDVDGVKIPFRWTFAWLDGRDSFQISEIRTNVAIDPAKYARPVSAKP
jgi:photosynthetic reaction center cytochrome c subunit